MTKSYSKYLLGVLLSIASHVGISQKSIYRENQQWVQYYGTIDINDKWIIQPDFGFRWKNDLNDRSLFIGRIGIGYLIDEKMGVAHGGCSTGAYSKNGLNRLEWRPFQELWFTNSLNKITIRSRFRIEERFFKNVIDGNITGGHNFNFRFRYQLSFSFPLIKFTNENKSRTLSFNVIDEIFFNAGKEITYNYFDKNRFVVGPSIQLNPRMNIGLFYNYQSTRLNLPNSYERNDVLWLTVRHHFNGLKKD